MMRSTGSRAAAGWVAITAALVATACGSSVVVDAASSQQGAGVGGGASTGTVTGTGTTTGTATSTGTGTGTGTSTGTGTGTSTGTGTGTSTGTSTCAITHDGVSFQLDFDDGGSYGCAAAKPGEDQEVEISGRVVEAAPDGVLVDTCSPLADCIPSYVRLSLWGSTPGWPIPNGALVRAHLRVEFPWGCGQKLLVTNLPEWGGLANPVRSEPVVWLAASDGLASTLDEAPFTVGAVPLHCGMEMGDAYYLRFALKDPKGDPGVDLVMGQTTTWAPQGHAPFEMWRLANLRSYESGAEDDYWNWSYWLVQAEGLD